MSKHLINKPQDIIGHFCEVVMYMDINIYVCRYLSIHNVLIILQNSYSDRISELFCFFVKVGTNFKWVGMMGCEQEAVED